jgi:hypothetical protein
MGWDRHSKRQVFQWHLVVLTILGEWRNIPWIISLKKKTVWNGKIAHL